METLRQLLGIQPIAALALAMLLVSATGLVVVVAIFIRHGGVMRLLHLFRNGNGKEQRGAHIDLAEKFSDLQESIESDFGEVKASLEELKTGQTDHSQEIALLFAKDTEVERRIDRLEGGTSDVEHYKGLLSEAIAAMRERHSRSGEVRG